MVSPSIKDLEKIDPYVRKQNAKLTQVVQNFFTKAVQVILNDRAEEADGLNSSGEKINKWFNLSMPINYSSKDDLKLWKSCSDLSTIPPMIIETSIDLKQLTNKDMLILRDHSNVPYSVVRGEGKKTEVVIERWLIEFDTNEVTGSIIDELPLIYKHAIILFRSLYGILKLMPAYKLRQKLQTTASKLSLSNRILDGKHSISSKGRVGLSKPIIPASKLTTSHLDQRNFNPVYTSLGALKVSVVYRKHYDFDIYDSEEVLSDQFIKFDSSKELGSSEIASPIVANEPDRLENESGAPEVEGEADDQRHRSSFRASMSISPNTAEDVSPPTKKAGTPSGRPIIQPFKVGSIGNSPPPTNYSNVSSSLERRISITSNKSTSNASLVAMLRNPRNSGGSMSSTTGNIPITSGNNQTTISIPRSFSSSHGSTMLHEIESQSLEHNLVGTPRFSSSFGSRASRRFSNTNIRQSLLQQNLNDQSYLGTSTGSTSSMNPLSGLYIDDDISDFVKMIDSKNDLRFLSSSSSSHQNQLDALGKFQLLQKQHQQLSDSVNQSLILHNSPGPSGTNQSQVSSRKSSHSQGVYSSMSNSPFDHRNISGSNLPGIDSKLNPSIRKEDKKQELAGPPVVTAESNKDVKGLSTTPSAYSNRRSIQYENVFEDDDGEDYYLQSKNNKNASVDDEDEDDDLLFTMSDMNLTKH